MFYPLIRAVDVPGLVERPIPAFCVGVASALTTRYRCAAWRLELAFDSVVGTLKATAAVIEDHCEKREGPRLRVPGYEGVGDPSPTDDGTRSNGRPRSSRKPRRSR